MRVGIIRCFERPGRRMHACIDAQWFLVSDKRLKIALIVILCDYQLLS